MQFFPEDRKKRIKSIIFLAVLALAIVYVNVFGLGLPSFGGSESAGLEDFPVADLPGDPASFLPGEQSGSAPGASPADGQAGLRIPASTELDLSLLEDERFTRLRDVPELQVLPEELGKPNPFQ